MTSPWALNWNQSESRRVSVVVVDISLFDELDSLGDADELLEALETAGYVSNSPF